MPFSANQCPGACSDVWLSFGFAIFNHDVGRIRRFCRVRDIKRDRKLHGYFGEGIASGVKRVINNKVIFESQSSGGVYVYRSTHDMIVCHIETDRLAMAEHGFPSGPFDDPAGMSGGPVIQEIHTTHGVVVFQLVGFIIEYSKNYDTFCFKPATWLNQDGTLKKRRELDISVS